MRSAKQSDSPCGYNREVYQDRDLIARKQAEVDRLRVHEDEVRRLLNERHERRFQALLPSAEPVWSGDFEGCVD
jgi:hypothetical protein